MSNAAPLPLTHDPYKVNSLILGPDTSPIEGVVRDHTVQRPFRRLSPAPGASQLQMPQAVRAIAGVDGRRCRDGRDVQTPEVTVARDRFGTREALPI